MTDEELIKKYRNGDALAFNEIYNRYKGTVRFFARNLYLLGADTEDLIQEGMLGLIEGVNCYKEGESSFKTFANVCIQNKLKSAVKSYAGKNKSPLNNSTSIYNLDELGFFGDNPEEVILQRESGNEIKNKMLNCLSSYEISVLELYLKGLTYEQIALKLQKNLKAIDNALQRARKKIIKEFKG